MTDDVVVGLEGVSVFGMDADAEEGVCGRND
jgi:hypothetical protein